ncbi:hypothetical protein Tco_1279052, partial [Tanacetum coccineum]
AFQDTVSSQTDRIILRTPVVSERLWVDKYSPNSFMELLGEEHTNREELRNKKIKESDQPEQKVTFGTSLILSFYYEVHQCSEKQHLHMLLLGTVDTAWWRPICLTAATTAVTPIAEKIPVMFEFNQNTRLDLDRMNVILKNTTGNRKSSGMNLNASINTMTSPKNGNITAIVVAMITYSDLEINLGITFLAENSVLVGSANALSRTSFVGCN